MSHAIGTSSAHGGRGSRAGHRHSLLHPQQQQRARDQPSSSTSPAARPAAPSASSGQSVGVPAASPLQQAQQPQLQNPRSRRPRSIHITLRKTRSGSRPVNILRYPPSSAQQRAFSPNEGTVADDEARGMRYGGTDRMGERQLSPSIANNMYSNNMYSSAAPPVRRSLLDSDHLHASAEDEDGEAYTPIEDEIGGRRWPQTQSPQPTTTPRSCAHSHTNPSNSVDSMTVTTTAISTPVASTGPRLNTFMRPPQAALQQLLPPNMRERVAAAPPGSINTNSGNDNGGTNSGSGVRSHSGAVVSHGLRSRSQLYLTSTQQQMLQHSTAYDIPPLSTSAAQRSNSSSRLADGVLTASYSGALGDFVFPYPGASTPRTGSGPQQQQPRTPLVGPARRRTASASAGASGAPIASLGISSPRLSSSAHLEGSYGSNTGGAVAGTNETSDASTAATATVAGTMMMMGGTSPATQVPRHTRSRSYTAGGRQGYPHRSSSTFVSAAMAGAGGAALFLSPSPYLGTSSNASSHPELHAQRPTDRSHSLSSTLGLGEGTVNVAGTSAATPPSSSTTAAAAVHNYTSGSRRSSLRGGLTREGTPVNAASATMNVGVIGNGTASTSGSTMGSAMATPTPASAHAPRRRPTLSSSAVSPRVVTPSAARSGNREGSTSVEGEGIPGDTTPTAATVPHNTNTNPSVAARTSTADSANAEVTAPVLQQQRSHSPPASSIASMDVVNGLADSLDSVRCGSTPRASHSPTRPAAVTATTRYMTLDSALSEPRAVQDIAEEDHVRGSEGERSTAAGKVGVTVQAPRYASTPTDDDEQNGNGDESNTKAAHERRKVVSAATAVPTAAAASTPPVNATNGPSTSSAQVQSTLERLRTRRGSHSGGVAPSSRTAADPPRTQQRSAAVTGEPKTAIERWRAQEAQRQREDQEEAYRHRLSIGQWREAFTRLEATPMRWLMRSFIGAGTSGKVYEGVLEDAARTPVAVKVLDVGVPMPVGPANGGDGGRSSGRNVREEPYMSPAQQTALLVLLREVEMMEKLHHENIVTCLRCQVTPVQDRILELHQQQQRYPRPSSLMRQDDDCGGDAGAGRRSDLNETPLRHNTPSSAAALAADGASSTIAAVVRIPVQVEIIMELCRRGTLANVVRRNPNRQLPVVVGRRYLRDVLKGLAYLHRNNFIHRDVKGENVLISTMDVAKLADFGCSRRIFMTNSHLVGEGMDGTMSSLGPAMAFDSRYATATEYQWCEAATLAQTMVGTPMFMAPEIIQGGGGGGGSFPMDSPHNDGADDVEAFTAAVAAAPVGYTASADIWSFGCLVLEVFGRTPWPTAGHSAYHLMKLIEQSVDDLPPGVPPNTPAELLDLLRYCFNRDPTRRSSARALLRTPWMLCKDEDLEEMPRRQRR